MKRTLVYISLLGAGLAIIYFIFICFGRRFELNIIYKTRPTSPETIIAPLKVTDLRIYDGLSHIFSAVGYKTVGIKTVNVRRLKKLGVTMYNQQTTNDERKISGKITVLTNTQVTIFCPACDSESTSVNSGANYMLTLKPNASPPYKITFIGQSGRKVVVEVNPQSPNDHATIDIAFDDSSPLLFF